MNTLSTAGRRLPGALGAAAICLLFCVGCSGGDMKQEKTAESIVAEIPAGAWNELARKRIFFGHQSVGSNIIDGLRTLAGEQPQAGFKIVEIAEANTPHEPAFFHAAIGTNGDPGSKLSAFGEIVRGDTGAALDIAFFKFCYLDISADTDVARVFAEYQREMTRLREARPNVTFAHVTVPLTAIQTGPAAWIKKRLGRPPGGVLENAKRNRFNLLMCLAYAGSEPLFDLALLESTHPGGSRASYIKDGTQHYCLAPEYTDDGGHLNAAGRRMVARELAIFLSHLSRE
jgi:hypothetical protein